MNDGGGWRVGRVTGEGWRRDEMASPERSFHKNISGRCETRLEVGKIKHPVSW